MFHEANVRLLMLLCVLLSDTDIISKMKTIWHTPKITHNTTQYTITVQHKNYTL